MIGREMAEHTLPIASPLDVVLPQRERETYLERLHDWVITVDHKRLGIMYVVYSLFFLLVGGAEAMCIRIQLARPDNHFLDPAIFNRFFTMHGTTMVFLVGMPILFGFANYLVPLMIGARDMAFPRLNAFSFWLTAFGGFSCISVLSAGLAYTGWAARLISHGGPMRHSPRAHFRRVTVRTTGRWHSSPAVSALSAQPSTLSRPLFRCAAGA
jgi:Cytochrome C and Quinol oxidase polypeptide I